MWKRKPTASTRSIRPAAETLESRQLLSLGFGKPTATVSGTDPDGASWTLRLYGPGTLNVVDANGTAFTAANRTTPDLINTITVAGAITSETRLVGTVIPSASGANQVHFQNLVVSQTGELGNIDPGRVSFNKVLQNGIDAIDMPNFWLTHTETAKPTTASLIHTSAKSAGAIDIPGGVITLRFGGVDATYTPPGGTPLNQSGQSNEFEINLGLPITTGTSVLVDKVITTAQANTTSGQPPFQDYATFLVSGRLNLFQANEIDGNTTSGLAPTQFAGTTPSSGLAPGGTYVISQGGVFGAGQIGTVRILGSATNFTTLVDEFSLLQSPSEGLLDAKINSFSIGGETNNVMLIAPSGSRNIAFGLGMDNVLINSLTISSLRANRDATNSTVTVSRSIGNMLIGGPVENTNVQAGYFQSLFAEANFPATSIFTSGSGVFFGTPPATITNHVTNPTTGVMEPYAQNGGSIRVRIAGDVTNSVISASVDPNPSGLSPSVVDAAGQFEKSNGNRFPFGAPNNIVLPRGVINAKVEGTVDNSTNGLVSTNAPASAAFFARVVHLNKGPVIPPTVPYQPYPHPPALHRGQTPLKGLLKLDHLPTRFHRARTASGSQARAAARSQGKAK
jgi:hypothetical protein